MSSRCWANADFLLLYVFLEPSFEGSTCLAHVRHLTVGAGQLVYDTFSIFALGIEFLFEVFSYRVVPCECNCYVRAFKNFNNVTGFFPDIRESSPFSHLCMCVKVLFFLLFKFWDVMVWVIFVVGQDLFYGFFFFLPALGDSLYDNSLSRWYRMAASSISTALPVRGVTRSLAST